VPTFETRFASQIERKTRILSGPSAECDGGAALGAADELDSLASVTVSLEWLENYGRTAGMIAYAPRLQQAAPCRRRRVEPFSCCARSAILTSYRAMDDSNERELIRLNVAVLTVSDTRTEVDDKSGAALVERVESAGHVLAARAIVKDDVYAIRATVSSWIADAGVDVVITTGGTGITGRDGTPEAVAVLLDKVIEGFGELFRAISFEDIGTSSLQSRCVAGVANGTYVFCVPGSTNACKTAWDRLI
jgi:molybdenum cofactor biosynthesis protein B